MNDLIQKIKSDYNLNCNIIKVNDIIFDKNLRRYCMMNSCGNYKKNYMCPPFIGETDELIQQVQKYNTAVVFQKVYKIEDSYDYEGMMDAQKQFKAIYQEISQKARETKENYLLLGVGGCQVCPQCAVIENLPCRYPELAHASLESYCIDVAQLANISDMKYINGVNTVTYFGALFVK